MNETYLIEEYQSKIVKNNNTEFRLNLFNNKSIHSELNLFFINYLLPLLQTNKKIIYKYISIDGEDYLFIILGNVYFIILTLMFIIAFILINKILNVQINETKLMLSIIPINFLTYQNNNIVNCLFTNN